ncbi:WD40 repeat-like protein [Pyrenochaeta sp. DS3sAY3a]|nr:WD40 repeat-like protein [Pyrenochaeta sp. DS3sAY3a]
MKYEALQTEPIGSLPIIIVTHSMGGLVAKKAFLGGKQDQDYVDIMDKVKSIIFFSTPHRGGNGSDGLSLLLKLVGMSKEYIKDLVANSTLLSSINDDFTNTCSDLQLFSFYEIMKTLTPIGNQYNSGILNLQNETSKPMAADHSNVCKFEKKDDPGYRDIRNVLINLITQHTSEAPSHPQHDTTIDLNDLVEMLAIQPGALDENLDRLLFTANEGSCHWIAQHRWFSTWLYEEEDNPHLMWISGPPAAGKSVLTAYITNLVRETWDRDVCQYHAFDVSDKPSQSASYMLRSFAYQIACSVSTFRTDLQKIEEQFGIAILKMNAKTIWEKVFRGALLDKVIGRTLYWVIDGLDETDSSEISLIFQCLRTLTHGHKIKVLLVSRETADIQNHVDQLPLRKSVHRLSTADTYNDICRYAEDVIGGVIPRSVPSRQTIIDHVLKKASGNFLWVTLAAKDLTRSWHRQSNIDDALSGLPGEMKPRYDRMMDKIEEQPESTKRMAIILLAWATYSFRPLQLGELKAALQSEFPDLISLEDTIKHICGDFIQMRGAKPVLIHETARHYLNTRFPHKSDALHPRTSHGYIATVCLEYLSSSSNRQWRQILSMADAGPTPNSFFVPRSARDIREQYTFLAYAATSWAYHLSLADPNSEALLDVVLEFFYSDVLTWINTLALFGDLGTLIRTAEYLRAFLDRRRKKLSAEKLINSKDESTSTLRLWVTDLIRLVGKFGSNLIQHPSSIYKLIPPFCPTNSMLRQASAQSTFSVEGITMDDWDDCHARLPLGTENSGRTVIATSEVFMALVPGAQCLVVWHAETFEELRRLQHGEYVIEAAVNTKGDLVCTAGRSTIKVWKLSTGQEVGSFPKHSDDRILKVGFGNQDSQILIGYQDHLIVCQDWKTQQVLYSFHAVVTDDESVKNGLRVISFSPDGNRLVVGSRNRPIDLWDLSTQSWAARCVMRDEVLHAETDVFLQPEVVQWHPNSGNIYILYHNTALVDWNPAYGEKTEHYLGAKGMACSPCANYLLTYEADGSVKVFRLPDYTRSQEHSFRPIYHLVHPEHIRDVTFSPDGRRFYDLRGTACSVWEPEVLVQPIERKRRDSQGSIHDRDRSLSRPPATTSRSAVVSVTAIACAPNDLGFCCGREDGTIMVHTMTNGAKIRSLPGHCSDMAIIGLTWSSSGRWIASADDSGRVLVRKVQMPVNPTERMKLFKPSDFRISSSGVNQLLFSSDDRYLLVSTLSGDKVWNLSEKVICHERQHSTPRRVKWIEHPSDPSRLVSIDTGELHIFNWNDFLDLTPGEGLRFDRTDHSSLLGQSLRAAPRSDSIEKLGLAVDMTSVSLGSLEVNSITQTGDRRSIVLETIPHEGYDRDRVKRRRIEFIRTKDISPNSASGGLSLQRSAPNVPREILRLVGTFQNHLVFFNHQHWLCTWELGTPIESYKKHLFLPKDWISSETLQLSTLSALGTLLYPKNGEVAMIKHGIKL